MNDKRNHRWFRFRISPEHHYVRTRTGCHILLSATYFGTAIVLVALNWNRVTSATIAAVIAAAVIAIGLWPILILSRLVCEIFRECTSVECTKCGGSMWLMPNKEGSFSTSLVTYECFQCGSSELLKVRYCDEIPRGGGHAGDAGTGGGGGG